MEITTLLVNAQSADQTIRKAAEAALNAAQESAEYGAFWLQCAGELASDAKPLEVRQLAGLILKNALDAKEDARRSLCRDKWINLDPGLKAKVKHCVMTALVSTAKNAGHTAAQVLAKIASIELPQKAWPELLPALMANVGTPARQATLEALGFMCEDLAGTDCLDQGEVDQVLTAVVQGIRKEEPDAEVRLAATGALLNALDFVDSNFDKEAERNYIMQVTCEATQCNTGHADVDARVRKVAFECLVRIAASYYKYLGAYITDIFTISVLAARTDEEEVALQAIELWSTLCEEELQLEEESPAENNKFVEQALPHLCPMLLETLLKQEEGTEGDDTVWNLNTAGGTCLGLVANTVGNALVPLILPFMQENATHENWRCREASLFAFGSMLDGPEESKLEPFVAQALPHLVAQLKDPMPHIQDTAAWTIGQAIKYVPGGVVPKEQPQMLSTVLAELLHVLPQGVPHVATKCCWAVSSLSEEYGAIMSPYFQNTVQTLLATTERPDSGDSGLRHACLDAVDALVRNTKDTMSLVFQLAPPMIGKLQESFANPAPTAEDRQRQADYCGVLLSIIVKLGENPEYKKQMIATYADQLMTLFLQVLSCNTASVQEDALQAIGGLVSVCEGHFIKYMEHFYPFLEQGLKNFQEYDVCTMTVEILGDLARFIGAQIPINMWERIVWQLLENLSSDALHRSVKPAILTCVGDIARALGPQFESCLQVVMNMLMHASKAAMHEPSDEDEMDHLITLRSCILQAYAGILQGMDSKAALLQPFAENIVALVAAIANSANNDAGFDVELSVETLGVLVDLLCAFDTMGSYIQQQQGIVAFVLKCVSFQDNHQDTPPMLKENAMLCKTKIEKQAGVKLG